MSRAGRRLALLALIGICVPVGLWLGLRRVPGPDVIVITIDTLRADRLGAYGYPEARTPTLDGLAGRGRLFHHAVTPMPRTTPALASLFTGLLPAEHGSRDVGQPMGDHTTLAEILRAEGYQTLAVSANGAAGPGENLDRGFSEFIPQKRLGGQQGRLVSDAALNLVRNAGTRKPIFLWVHYMDPHFPYWPPREYRTAARAERCRTLWAAIQMGNIRRGAVLSNEAGLSELVLDTCSRLYDDEIAYVDSEVGRLLEGLWVLRNRRPAVILLTSDHGENFGERGLWYEHGDNLHGAGVDIPLILAAPGIEPGVDKALFPLEHALPALLGLLGLEAEVPPAMRDPMRVDRFGSPASQAGIVARLESGSALQVAQHNRLVSGRRDGEWCVNGARLSLCGEGTVPRGLYDPSQDPQLSEDLSADHPEELRRLLAIHRRWPPESARERAAQTARFKLLDRPRPEGGYHRTLHDLQADPGETVDVLALHPGVAAELAEVLDAWAEEIPPPVKHEPSERDLEKLRSLGYIE